MFFIKKSQIVCRGAKIYFCRSSGCQKRVFEKKYAFFVFVFYILEKETRKENMEKEQVLNRKLCCLGGCERKALKGSFVIMAFVEKLANTICVWKVKNSHFR